MTRRFDGRTQRRHSFRSGIIAVDVAWVNLPFETGENGRGAWSGNVSYAHGTVSRQFLQKPTLSSGMSLNFVINSSRLCRHCADSSMLSNM